MAERVVGVCLSGFKEKGQKTNGRVFFFFLYNTGKERELRREYRCKHDGGGRGRLLFGIYIYITLFCCFPFLLGGFNSRQISIFSESRD